MLVWLKKVIFIVIIGLLSNLVNAHMFWLERVSNGNTLAYFGEPLEAKKEATDKSAFLKEVTVEQAGQTFKGSLQDNHLLFATKPTKDVRLATQLVHKDMLVLFRAKNNSNEQQPTMDYEFVKVQDKPNTFQLFFNNQPAAKNKVLLVNPDLTSQQLTTDKDGQLIINIANKGQYILQASNGQDKLGEFNGKTYQKVIYITTLTFTNP